MADHPRPGIKNKDLPDTVRAILNLLQKEPYLQHVELVVQNIRSIKSETADVINTDLFNPNIRIVKLENLKDQRRKRTHSCVILMILSISPVTSQGITFKYDQKAKGSQGTNQQHDHRLVVMCPSSKSGSNAAIVFLGSGICKQFWNNDTSLRENGSICKYYIILKIYIILIY